MQAVEEDAERRMLRDYAIRSQMRRDAIAEEQAIRTRRLAEERLKLAESRMEDARRKSLDDDRTERDPAKVITLKEFLEHSQKLYPNDPEKALRVAAALAAGRSIEPPHPQSLQQLGAQMVSEWNKMGTEERERHGNDIGNYIKNLIQAQSAIAGAQSLPKTTTVPTETGYATVTVMPTKPGEAPKVIGQAVPGVGKRPFPPRRAPQPRTETPAERLNRQQQEVLNKVLQGRTLDAALEHVNASQDPDVRAHRGFLIKWLNTEIKRSDRRPMTPFTLGELPRSGTTSADELRPVKK
jgi:hypothetical protein